MNAKKSKKTTRRPSLTRRVSPLPCPFCGVLPREYDGDHVLSHAIGCFFTQQYAQEMWIVGRRRMEWWNKRANK